MTEITREWLNFAEMDINSANYLLTMRPTPIEIICYHCQQCAEKALKESRKVLDFVLSVLEEGTEA